METGGEKFHYMIPENHSPSRSLPSVDLLPVDSPGYTLDIPLPVRTYLPMPLAVLHCFSSRHQLSTVSCASHSAFAISGDIIRLPDSLTFSFKYLPSCDFSPRVWRFHISPPLNTHHLQIVTPICLHDFLYATWFCTFTNI